MLERVISNLQESSVDEIVVVLGYRHKEVERDLSESGFDVVINSEYESGMSTSLKAGMNVLNEETEAVLVVLADQPLLEPETVDAIIEKYKGSEFSIVAPFYKGERGNPVLLDMSLRDEIMQIQGDMGARGILNEREDEVGEVEVSTPSVVLDVDTEQDKKRIKKFFEG